MASGDAADDARFLQVSNDDSNQFIDEMKNNNTKKENKKWSDKILSEWLQGDNELSAVEDIPSADLNQYLARSFLSVGSQKNKEYEPDSFKLIQLSVSIYLMEKNGTNILQDCWIFVKILINMTYSICDINMLKFKM